MFNHYLVTAEQRIANTGNSYKILLDKNEQSQDIMLKYKIRVTEQMMNLDWNRYPDADYSDIEANIANYCGLAPDNIVLASGSASIITTLLNYFAINRKQINIVQPSYSLFDYHCKTYNIPYNPWYLNDNLDYDLALMPELEEDAVVIITSPNNPTGNSIKQADLEYLLQTYPKAMIILDGVYCEFSSNDMTNLVRQYKNLIVLRSFSKAFPIAGLRLGYLCAAPETAKQIKKLVLQFSITPFSITLAREVLFTEEFLQDSKKRINDIIAEREMITSYVTNKFREEVVKVYRSEGNFLLMHVPDGHTFDRLMNEFRNNEIKVLNTSPFIKLANTFRVSIGSKIENEQFLICMCSVLGVRNEFKLNPAALLEMQN